MKLIVVFNRTCLSSDGTVDQWYEKNDTQYGLFIHKINACNNVFVACSSVMSSIQHLSSFFGFGNVWYSHVVSTSKLGGTSYKLGCLLNGWGYI